MKDDDKGKVAGKGKTKEPKVVPDPAVHRAQQALNETWRLLQVVKERWSASQITKSDFNFPRKLEAFLAGKYLSRKEIDKNHRTQREILNNFVLDHFFLGPIFS